MLGLFLLYIEMYVRNLPCTAFAADFSQNQAQRDFESTLECKWRNCFGNSKI